MNLGDALNNHHRVEPDDWRLEVGGWRLEIGDWRLEIGGCRVTESISKDARGRQQRRSTDSRKDYGFKEGKAWVSYITTYR